MSPLGAESFTEAASLIMSLRRPLLISHAKADGDALGALVAMRALLASRGVDATPLLFEPISDHYAVFSSSAPMPVWGVDRRAADLADTDGVIVLDTCTYNQLEPIADWLRDADVPKLAIDHHVTRDGLADHYVVDESAAATCLILYEWARALDWSMSPDTCEALFVGIATDTGWFRHSNTDERVLAAAADLAACGVRPHELYDQLFHRESPARVRLLAKALSTLELHANDRLAVMTLASSAISGAGATTADTEDIINEPLRIGSVVVSVLLVQADNDLVRASFRSKSPHGSECVEEAQPKREAAPRFSDIDVAGIAQTFGGGGHKRAAGARIKGTLREVSARVVSHVEPLLSDGPTPRV